MSIGYRLAPGLTGPGASHTTQMMHMTGQTIRTRNDADTPRRLESTSKSSARSAASAALVLAMGYALLSPES